MAVCVFYEFRKFRGSIVIKENTELKLQIKNKIRLLSNSDRKIGQEWVDLKHLMTMSVMLVVV